MFAKILTFEVKLDIFYSRDLPICKHELENLSNFSSTMNKMLEILYMFKLCALI